MLLRRARWLTGSRAGGCLPTGPWMRWREPARRKGQTVFWSSCLTFTSKSSPSPRAARPLGEPDHAGARAGSGQEVGKAKAVGSERLCPRVGCGRRPRVKGRSLRARRGCGRHARLLFRRPGRGQSSRTGPGQGAPHRGPGERGVEHAGRPPPPPLCPVPPSSAACQLQSPAGARRARTSLDLQRCLWNAFCRGPC